MSRGRLRAFSSPRNFPIEEFSIPMKFKSAIGAIAAVLALAAAAFGQNASPAGGPKIVIKQVEYNFGEIKKGVTAEHTFTFKNEGKADLEIKSVAPS